MRLINALELKRMGIAIDGDIGPSGVWAGRGVDGHLVTDPVLQDLDGETLTVRATLLLRAEPWMETYEDHARVPIEMPLDQYLALEHVETYYERMDIEDHEAEGGASFGCQVPGIGLLRRLPGRFTLDARPVVHVTWDESEEGPAAWELATAFAHMRSYGAESTVSIVDDPVGTRSIVVTAKPVPDALSLARSMRDLALRDA